jgi:putative flippase GtrA
LSTTRGFVGHFSRYTLVGAFATAAHYLVLVLCVEAWHWPAWLASGWGAAVGAQVAYAGNRWFTFAHRGTIGASWPRFMLTALLGALLGMAVVGLGVRLGVHYLIAQVLATLASLVLTFAINRLWTFR